MAVKLGRRLLGFALPGLCCLLLSLSPAAAELVDINGADQNALDQLPGIGPAKAKAIVQYRQEHGPFQSVEALDAVPGIGPKLMSRLRDKVRVRPAVKTTPVAAPSTTNTAAGRPAAIIQGQGQTRFFDAQGRPIHMPAPRHRKPSHE